MRLAPICAMRKIGSRNWSSNPRHNSFGANCLQPLNCIPSRPCFPFRCTSTATAFQQNHHQQAEQRAGLFGGREFRAALDVELALEEGGAARQKFSIQIKGHSLRV